MVTVPRQILETPAKLGNRNAVVSRVNWSTAALAFTLPLNRDSPWFPKRASN